jgi:hypothetical protein
MTGERPPERCVVVLDDALAPGFAANAAAVVALTLGATAPMLVGAELVDADGHAHPGLIPIGLPILCAPGSSLAELRARALASEVGVIDLPTLGQQTNDYDEFRRNVAQTPGARLEYAGLALHGPKRAITRLTGNLRLLR